MRALEGGPQAGVSAYAKPTYGISLVRTAHDTKNRLLQRMTRDVVGGTDLIHTKEDERMSTMVLIELKVKPESVDDMKALMKELLPDTRAYDGCQSVDFYDNTETKGSMVLYEIWDSKAHQERYLGWRTETGTLDRLGALVAAQPNIQYFDKVDA